MFDDYSKYPKEKVKLFFKYLVNAARRQALSSGQNSESGKIKKSLVEKNIEKKSNISSISKKISSIFSDTDFSSSASSSASLSASSGKFSRSRLSGKASRPALISSQEHIEKRLKSMTPERKEELESKIKIFYTKNRLLPYEEKLKKLKRRYYNLKRRKSYSKTKLEKIQRKIKACEKILKNLKKEETMYE